MASLGATTNYLPWYLLPMRRMSTHPNTDTGNSADASEPAGIETVESYEVDDGVVLFDAENPLAWVETTEAVPVTEAV